MRQTDPEVDHVIVLLLSHAFFLNDVLGFTRMASC